MAKIFTPNQNNNQINTPTAEQNEAEYLSIQLRKQQIDELRRQDSLAIEMKKQYTDLDLATQDAGQAVIDQKYGNTDRINQNQDMSKYPETKNTDVNTLGKLTDSVPPVITNIFFAFLAIVVIRFLFGKKG